MLTKKQTNKKNVTLKKTLHGRSIPVIEVTRVLHASEAGMSFLSRAVWTGMFWVLSRPHSFKNLKEQKMLPDEARKDWARDMLTDKAFLVVCRIKTRENLNIQSGSTGSYTNKKTNVIVA